MCLKMSLQFQGKVGISNGISHDARYQAQHRLLPDENLYTLDAHPSESMRRPVGPRKMENPNADLSGDTGIDMRKHEGLPVTMKTGEIYPTKERSKARDVLRLLACCPSNTVIRCTTPA
jgi:hypothetical protein